MAQPIVIGLCGSYYSGCTTVANFLTSNHGYRAIKLSDKVAEIASASGLDCSDKKVLQDTGNKIREEHGNDFLAEWAIGQIEESDKFVVLDAIRNVAEIIALRKQYANFFLIGITADYDVRRERARSDNVSEANFDAVDRRDIGEDSIHGQQVRLCMDFADVVLRNNEQILDLNVPGQTRELELIIARYHTLFSSEEVETPTPTEFLMGVADNAAMLSWCIKRQVGAVLCSQDKEVIAVGQNNPPPASNPCRSEYNKCYRSYVRENRPYKCSECDDVITAIECPHCNKELNRRSLAGKELDYCRSVHAEEHIFLQMSKRYEGIPKESILFVTTFPCFMCAKKIASTDIVEVVYGDPYPMQESYELLKDVGIKLTPFEGVKSNAFHVIFKKHPALVKEVISDLAVKSARND